MSSVRNNLRAARAALKARQWQRARALYAQVLAVDAAHAEALSGTGSALLGAGAIDEALAWYQRALSQGPGSPELMQGYARARARAVPDDAVARGLRSIAEGRIEEACQVLQNAVQQSPEDGRALEALGQALLADGRLDLSAGALEESIRLEAGNARAHVWLADVHSARGHEPAAERALRDALRIAPALGQAWLRLAHLRRFRSEDDADLAGMRALIADAKLAAPDAEALHFALGKAYDDLDQPDRAFSHLARAHELHRKLQPFDTSALLGLIDRIAAVCDAAFFARHAGWGSDSELPVFVVGMPRCGSTLVEQIISSHPRAYGVGELRALARLTADLPSRLRARAPFPECLRALERARTDELAAAYLRRLTRDAPEDVLRVCDKMLSHVLLIGLIAVVFPKARVIHCRRELMAVGLSIYMHSFSGTGVGYAHDLEDIGRYYQASERLMDHWKRVSPIRIVDVQYEDLVRDPEPGVRALLDAVGLDFDPRCLESHRAERQVRTVSNWQVRQPIHQKSVARWRRYERHLEPLRKYSDQEP